MILPPAIWVSFSLPPIKKKFGDSPLPLEDSLVSTPKSSDWINEMMWRAYVLCFFSFDFFSISMWRAGLSFSIF